MITLAVALRERRATRTPRTSETEAKTCGLSSVRSRFHACATTVRPIELVDSRSSVQISLASAIRAKASSTESSAANAAEGFSPIERARESRRELVVVVIE